MATRVPLPAGAGVPPVPPVGAGGGAAAAGPAMWPDDVVPREHHRVLGYFKWSLIFIGGFLLPTSIAAILNSLGWKGGIVIEIALINLAFFMLLPAIIGGSSLVDFLGRLKWIFKKPAADAPPAEKERWGRLAQVFNVSVITFIAALIGPMYLLLVEIKGHGDYAGLLVAFVPVAVLYVLAWSRSATFVKAVGKYTLYGVIALAVIWPVAQFFPGVTQGAVKVYRQATTWVAKQWTTYGFKSTTSQARGNVELASAQLLETLRTDCLTVLETRVKTAIVNKVVIPETEVTAEVAKCEAIGAAPKDVSPAAKPATSGVSNYPPAQDRSPAATPAAIPTVPTATIPPKGRVVTLNQGDTNSSFALGGCGAQRCRVVVEGWGGEQLFPDPAYPNGYRSWKMDPRGVYQDNGRAIAIPVPADMAQEVPAPQFNLGALVILAGNQPLGMAGDNTCFTAGELTARVNARAEVRSKGNRTWSVRVEQC